jgi:AcrR family transcriptional regulator
MVRSRSIEAHEKVLRAALDLFAERGIEAASMDAIAQQSGVSKATIYNHWEDKEALLLEVMSFIHGLDRQREDIDTGDLCRDLTTVLTRRHPEQFDEYHHRIVPALIAYSATHKDFGQAWRNRVMDPPRAAIRAILRRNIERGLLPPALNIEHSIPLLLGPVLYVHIFPGQSRLTKDDIGPAAAEEFCKAFTIGNRAQVIVKKDRNGKKKSKPKR